jgi:hypothetical protein
MHKHLHIYTCALEHFQVILTKGLHVVVLLFALKALLLLLQNLLALLQLVEKKGILLHNMPTI